jgi:hypothetical protein
MALCSTPKIWEPERLYAKGLTTRNYAIAPVTTTRGLKDTSAVSPLDTIRRAGLKFPSPGFPQRPPPTNYKPIKRSQLHHRRGSSRKESRKAGKPPTNYKPIKRSQLHHRRGSSRKESRKAGKQAFYGAEHHVGSRRSSNAPGSTAPASERRRRI